MSIIEGENSQIKNKIRVPQVFQVFPEVSNRVVFDMNIIVYTIHRNIDNAVIYIILKVYLSKKIESDLIPY